MSAQKQKKSPWVQCDKCLVTLVSRDTEKHLKDCPPNVKDLDYNFIQHGALYGTLDVKVKENIKNLTPMQVDNLVFLGQGAMQLCSFSITQWVVIQSSDEYVTPIAKKVWPTTEKSLTSVLLTKNSLDLSTFKANEQVKVSSIEKNAPLASKISLVLLNGPKSLELVPELYNRVSKSHDGRMLTKGNKIYVMFYGSMLKFEIKHIERYKDQSNVENILSKLSMSDKHEFFVINDNTKWLLYKNPDTYDTEVHLEKRIISTLAGVDNELQEIQELMQICLHDSKIPQFIQTRSVLLYGNSGTAKTMIAKALAQESKANIVTICAPDLYTKSSESIEQIITEMFQDAIEHAPSVIVLDEIDSLCPIRTNSRLTDSEKRIISTLLLQFDSLNEKKNPKVFIIATTNKPDSIDPAFRRCGRLDREIEIPTPTPKNRKSILDKLLEIVPIDLSDDDLHEVALSTHGFVGADLVSLCSSASLNANKRGKMAVTLGDFKFALKKVRPSAMREVQIEMPNIKWSDIGGQENLKLILKQAVEWPLRHPESFKRLGITPPRGVLMFGPPGCSKTMIAKALATESSLNFLSIKGPELFSKWVGESERAVREVFRKARQVAPSIIFFDEIDALGGERSSGSSTSVQERVLAQLLTELDGVTPLGDVTILAATNRPDRIDKALLRPGRLDRIVYVPLPDENTRRDIFRIKFLKMPILNVDIEDLVKKTERYSGAEVNAVCHEAAMTALEENLEIEHVEIRHFEKALKLITPRTPSELLKIYDDYLQIKV